MSKTGTDCQYDYRYAQELTSSNLIHELNQGSTIETIRIIENKILTEQWSP
ncbi:hypothetical protein OAO18_06435 [Francisellaceae bacterium]|nr:hypothetical protein [Francisellaceae bacterium]